MQDLIKYDCEKSMICVENMDVQIFNYTPIFNDIMYTEVKADIQQQLYEVFHKYI